MEFKDYYQVLGVKPDAETKEIKTAYRKLARKYHPDLNPDKDAEARFKEVAEAWEVLKDPGRRAEYDELRQYGGGHREQFRPPPGWTSRGAGEFHRFNGDFSEFFNSIFGGFATGRESGPADFGVGGRDIEIEMPVFLEETLEDTRKPVEYDIPVFEGGQLHYQRKTLRVNIPAGVADGERIRVKGQGAPGTGQAPPGDLYLHIRLVPHPVFDVEGHNLLLTVPVAPWEAALGAKVIVPTLNGRISLTVAPGSQTGQKLRVRGKGLVGRSGRGDLIAVLKVVMPDTTTAESGALWRQLAQQADFNPRDEWSKRP